MPVVFVSGGFDDPLSRHVRFLQEASRQGSVHVLLWNDEAVEAVSGRAPRLPLAERRYYLESLRYVGKVTVTSDAQSAASAAGVTAATEDRWAATDVLGDAGPAGALDASWCARHGVLPLVLKRSSLAGFPRGTDGRDAPAARPQRPVRRVIVTGSFDWLHTGHMRFFEEAAALGELTVVVGHDANIRLLKGEGHPRFGQEERLFMVGAVRTVTRSLLSSGSGWMDAAPEIERLKPDVYVVNEDGDKPGKREYCREHGLEYVVLKRAPKPGLPRRSSTDLRGF
jgi:cytidyltransferase-like protein